MFIKNLTIQNYGPFQNCDISLWDEENRDRKVTLLIGENGAGKTVFLEAIVTLLSWLVARIRSEKNTGSPITLHRIHFNESYAKLFCKLYAEKEEYSWSLVKTRKGILSKQESVLKDSSKLANIYSAKITNNTKESLPLFVYYSTERYVLDIPKRIKKRHTFSQIDGYDNALKKGIDFRLFFEWFRNIEDILNENKISIDEISPYIDKKKLTEFLSKNNFNMDLSDVYSSIDYERMKKEDSVLFKKLQLHERPQDQQYLAVMHAIESFMPGYRRLRIERHPKMRMLLDKNGQELDIIQLSQGEKSLLALVGDIARRLAIMNPLLSNPLEGKGIILIDEIDLHLHPRWQRTIVRRLRNTFPNCQFILTTHSPLVVSDPDNVQIFTLESGEITVLPNIYGMDIEQLYLEIMNTPLRDEQLQKEIDSLYMEIQNGNIENAKKIITKLQEKIPTDHAELVKAKILIRRFEVMREKNY